VAIQTEQPSQARQPIRTMALLSREHVQGGSTRKSASASTNAIQSPQKTPNTEDVPTAEETHSAVQHALSKPTLAAALHPGQLHQPADQCQPVTPVSSMHARSALNQLGARSSVAHALPAAVHVQAAPTPMLLTNGKALSTRSSPGIHAPGVCASTVSALCPSGHVPSGLAVAGKGAPRQEEAEHCSGGEYSALRCIPVAHGQMAKAGANEAQTGDALLGPRNVTSTVVGMWPCKCTYGSAVKSSGTAAADAEAVGEGALSQGGLMPPVSVDGQVGVYWDSGDRGRKHRKINLREWATSLYS
jgi:hypothetical protein